MPKQIKEKYKEFGEEGTYMYVALVTLLPLVIRNNKY